MSQWPWWAAFLTGLLGGGHCLGMCGGLVTALTLQLRRQTTLGLWLYNLGRLSSYVLVGALAGTLGAGTAWFHDILPLQRMLAVFSHVLLIILGLYVAQIWQGILVIERAGSTIWRQIEPLARRLLPVETLGQAYVAGVLWGWLPCGLVYSWVVNALTTGSAVGGASLMLAFGIGTLPNLLVMGHFAQQLRQWQQRPWVRLCSGWGIVAFGFFGLWRQLAS